MPLLSSLSPKNSSSYHHMSTESSEDALEESSTPRKDQESDPFLEHEHFPSRRSLFRNICGYAIVGVMGLIMCSISSQIMRVEYETDGYPAPYGQSSRLTSVVWNANASFADEPSALTDAAWDSLIPKGRGFVVHPKLAPADGRDNKGKSVSVFHELHCLVSRRMTSETSESD
jgi:hypothetical protein